MKVILELDPIKDEDIIDWIDYQEDPEEAIKALIREETGYKTRIRDMLYNAEYL